MIEKQNNEQRAERDTITTQSPMALWGSQAVLDVAAERRRQVENEGYDPAHDDEHDNGSMAEAAASYAYQAHNSKPCPAGKPPQGWPWDAEWWKPGNSRRMLVKAGALILAEIERLDRQASHTGAVSSHTGISQR